MRERMPVEPRYDFSTESGMRLAIGSLVTATHEHNNLWEVTVSNDEACAVVWRTARLRWWEYLPFLAWSSRRLGPNTCYVYPDGRVNLTGLSVTTDGEGVLPAPARAIKGEWLRPEILADVVQRAIVALESTAPVAFRLRVTRASHPLPDGTDVRLHAEAWKAGAPADSVTASYDSTLVVSLETDLSGKPVPAGHDVPPTS